MSFLMIGSVLNKTTHINTHEHRYYEITLCTEGEGVAVIGDTEYPFHKGSIFVIPPNVSHKSSSESGYAEIYIQTDNPPTPCLNSIDVSCFKDDDEGAITTLMLMILHRYIRGEKNDLIISQLYELISNLIAEKSTAPQIDPVIENVCRVLAINYSDPQLSLHEILESTGYNKDYIRRRFFAVCGITPNKYLTALRIENAKKLLRQKNNMRFSISDVSVLCGYYDPNYFSRVFKKHVGVTPEQFATQNIQTVTEKTL